MGSRNRCCCERCECADHFLTATCAECRDLGDGVPNASWSYGVYFSSLPDGWWAFDYETHFVEHDEDPYGGGCTWSRSPCGIGTISMAVADEGDGTYTLTVTIIGDPGTLTFQKTYDAPPQCTTWDENTCDNLQRLLGVGDAAGHSAWVWCSYCGCRKSITDVCDFNALLSGFGTETCCTYVDDTYALEITHDGCYSSALSDSTARECLKDWDTGSYYPCCAAWGYPWDDFLNELGTGGNVCPDDYLAVKNVVLGYVTKTIGGVSYGLFICDVHLRYNAVDGSSLREGIYRFESDAYTDGEGGGGITPFLNASGDIELDYAGFHDLEGNGHVCSSPPSTITATPA